MIKLLLLLTAINASSIELSIEENRMKRGGVGFVDIRRVYDELPDTRKAKEDFQSEIKKRDTELQSKRKELRALREELRKLEGERDFLKMMPIPVSTAAAVPSQSTGAAAASPGAEAPLSHDPTSPPVSPEPRIEGLPGFESAPGTPPPPTQDPPPPSSLPEGRPGMGEDRAERMRRLEQQIETQRAAVAAAEKEFKALGGRLEGELKSLESEKSRALLGRIHRELQRLAREAGVSVVIDKGSILFGHEAVDLTDSLIDSLKRSEGGK